MVEGVDAPKGKLGLVDRLASFTVKSIGMEARFSRGEARAVLAIAAISIAIIVNLILSLAANAPQRQAPKDDSGQVKSAPGKIQAAKPYFLSDRKMERMAFGARQSATKQAAKAAARQMQRQA
ncbi:MAG: hypothetical protein WC717_03090 [Candidatus Micrarchaeia archaeon]|jgi:hypothetical protein